MANEPPTTPQDYVTDLAYVRNYVPDLGPGRLRLAAALNGFPQPPPQGFDYCELGCGQGDTLVALAAAMPDSRFVGVDFNAEHIKFAESLAERGAVRNLRLLDRDFTALEAEQLPEFDFITAHGVLSWVSPATREALLDFAARKLKPGGLLYVGYNAMPGWAALEPLRRLLLEASTASSGDTQAKATHALQVAQVLSNAGAEYFTHHPTVHPMLAKMTRVGIPYVAHEFFNAHWEPLYFADVARQMADCSLYFVGQLPAYLNYRDLAVPPATAQLFSGVTNRVEFETLKDYANNEFFRGDIFMKGGVLRADHFTRQYLDSTPFGRLSGGIPIRREMTLPHYTLKFEGPLYDLLIPELASSTATLAELAERPGLGGFELGAIRDGLLRLLLTDHVGPALRSTSAIKNPGVARRYRIPLDYNRMILSEPLKASAPVVLASTVSGSGLPVSMLSALCLRLLTQAGPEGRVELIKGFVERNPIRLTSGDKVVQGAKDQQLMLLGELGAFVEMRLPEMIRLGVVEPEG